MELIQWDVTTACNLKCKHCRLGDIRLTDELSFNEAIDLLKQSKDLGVKFFNFSGGEPFVRGDIFKLIDFACSIFEEVTVTTNGTLINEEVGEKLSNHKNLRLSVSLDGYGSEHDEFRGVNGAFDKTIEGLKILSKKKVRISIKFTASKFTKNPFKLIELAKELGAESFNIRSVIPVGRADKDMMLDTRDYINLIKEVIEYGRKLKVRIISGDPILIPLFPELVGETQKTLLNQYMGCLAGSETLYINAKGDVFPCAYLPLKVGNIRESTLREIVNSKILKNLGNYRNHLTGKCETCKYKYICGGCRAVALAINGNVFSEDPRCMVGENGELYH